MNIHELTIRYANRYRAVLCPLAKRLEGHLRSLVHDYPRIDGVTVRAKAVSSFVGKAGRRRDSGLKYSDPFHQIQDQIGARITTYYLADVEAVRALVERYLRPIESRHAAPEEPSEFGYEGHHYLFSLPTDVLRPVDEDPGETPKFFELQIKTLFQHAWSQAAHDLAYKMPSELTVLQKRKVAFSAAQGWGADLVFDGLARELLNNEVAEDPLERA